MSRIDQVMRELSDLRSFYLKIQQSKRTRSADESVVDAVAEGPADYNTDDSSDRVGSGLCSISCLARERSRVTLFRS